MDDKKRGSADDPTESERRKKLTDEQVKELELAGGVEGGMQAGSAGGPGNKSVAKPQDKESKKGG
ncbi:MAG TPA: hypothetical protein VFK28_06525 [Sphingomicrobium sp.]|nr:hypothetical protein [Sphingomicrobium sp.]